MVRRGRDGYRPHHHQVLIRVVMGNGEGKVVNSAYDATSSPTTFQVGVRSITPRRAPAPVPGPWSGPGIALPKDRLQPRIRRAKGIRGDPALRHEVSPAGGTPQHDPSGAIRRLTAPKVGRAGRQHRCNLVVNRIEPFQGEVTDGADRAKAPLRPQHVERNAPLVQRGEKAAKGVVQRVDL